MDEYIATIERAYAAYGRRTSIDFPRHTLWAPAASGRRKSLKLLAAADPEDEAIGGYVYSGGYGHNRGWQKCFLLYDYERGNLRAVIEAEHLSWLKTGAVSAVAARHLSREDASRVGIFGAGRQAVTQLEGLCAVRTIGAITVYARRAAAREEFCRMMGARLNLPVTPVSRPEEALAGSDIIVTATTAKEPVFDGSLLRPGMHVNAIGAHYREIRELDEQALRGRKIVVDTLFCLEESGEFVIPGLDKKDIHAELGELAAHKKPGRVSPAEITIFKSAGRGVEYLALAKHVYRKIMSPER
jgi:ornithine cyclodeaminase/alanine dehydrogenase-like protein (mu-crystallin family)